MKKRILVDSLFIVGALFAIFAISELYISPTGQASAARGQRSDATCPFYGAELSALEQMGPESCVQSQATGLLEKIDAAIQLSESERKSVQKVLTDRCAALRDYWGSGDIDGAEIPKEHRAQIEKIRDEFDKKLLEILGTERFAAAKTAMDGGKKQQGSACCGSTNQGGPGQCSKCEGKSKAACPHQTKSCPHSPKAANPGSAPEATIKTPPAPEVAT